MGNVINRLMSMLIMCVNIIFNNGVNYSIMYNVKSNKYNGNVNVNNSESILLSMTLLVMW
jgi:hypothetical protein